VAGEWYRPGSGPESRFPSYSVAKSVVSLLVGQEVAAGRLSEDDRLVDVVAWLAGDDRYGDITIRHLLDMQSGIDVAEVYTNPLSPVARMYVTSDLDGFLERNRKLFAEPGSVFDYRSVDTALLGVVVEQVTGRDLADLVSERLWEPIGAEFDASWSLDRASGREKAFCCLNASARDFARLGQLVLDDGRVDGREVVPEAWIERIFDRGIDIGGGWAYSAQWWLPPTGEVVASGIHGQLIVVDRQERTVVVRLADDDLDRDVDAILATLDALVDG
jgi:CubicO group peptidase (beta-lactamase class C family)